jgi:UDP-N-acetylmuramoyl-tripeptide--D-alanyl-D-alanine ligase
LFDGYNANPESMGAAIENFSELKVSGRKFAVLGEMKEMGEHAKTVHRELGEKVARAGFDGVCFFGPSKHEFAAGLESAGYLKKSFISDTYEQSLASNMLPVLDGNDIVLMKGSRGMALEKALLDMKPIDFQVKK